MSAGATISLTPPTGTFTYYVDSADGSDSNPGTLAKPWKTIAKVNAAKLAPGQSVGFIRGGVWREALTPGQSGTAASPITFAAYGSGPNPIINGSNLLSSWTSDVAAYYSSVPVQPNQVFENGIRYTQVSTKVGLTPGTFWWDSVDKRVYIITSDNESPSRYAIEASQRTFGVEIESENYISLANLDVMKSNADGIDVYTAIGISIASIIAEYNYEDGVHEWTGSGFDVLNLTNSILRYNGDNGYEPNSIANSIISGNTVYNNCAMDISTTPDFQYCAGLRLEGIPTANVTVEYNTVYNNGITRLVYQEVAGIWLDTVGTANIVRYNTVYDNLKYGIFNEASSGTSIYYNVVYGHVGTGTALGRGLKVGRGSQNVLTCNNTIYGNTRGLAAEGDNHNSGAYQNNTFENNLSTGNTVDFLGIGGAENDGRNGSGNIYRYNSFGRADANFIEWAAGTYYSSYAAWETAIGSCGATGCSHSVQFDPLFTSASDGDFTPLPGSPAISAGLYVPGVSTASPPNIGAK
jgi:hypothetical protein